MELEEIKRQNLRTYARKKYGIDCNSRGYAICPFHPDEKKPSFQIYFYDKIWRWTDWHIEKGDPNRSGTIIDLVMRMENISLDEAISKLKKEFDEELIKEYIRKKRTRQNLTIETSSERTEFIYRDAEGNEIYKKVKGKDNHGERIFYIQKKTETGWENSEGDFDPIPYKLDEFKDNEKVLIVEGEKDADTVNNLNADIFATSTPTGKSNFDDRLIPYFGQFKEVIFLYDVGADEDVKRHMAKIQRAYAEMDIYQAKVPMEEIESDITDYLKLSENPVEALQKVLHDKEKFIEEQRQIEIPIRRIQPVQELEINNSFLNLWVESLSQITDAPKTFLKFSGIALLSGILNKFYFKFPRRTHLNLYILLLAPSTYYRKTTCTDFVRDYLEEINPKLLLPELFTVEALYKFLGEEEKPKKLIIWPELAQFKELQMGKEYNRGFAAFLTDIYDYKKKWRKWTVGDGEITVEEPVISILTAGITDWFVKNLNPMDFHGGLWTRFLFVSIPEMERIYTLPRPFMLDSAITRRLTELNDLEGGEVDISRILPMMKEWGTRHQEETMNLGTGILSAMFQRLEVMLIKLASIFQISHNQTQVLTPDCFEEAVKEIENLKIRLRIFFNEDVWFEEFDKAKAGILKFIKKKERAMKTEILQGTKIGVKLANPVLQQLEEEGEIKKTDIPTPGGGKLGKLYEFIGGQN